MDKHRFSGGMLIYDFINTVAHRRKSRLRTDRLAVCGDATDFANAARLLREDEVHLYRGAHAIAEAEHALLLDIRETAYAHFQLCLARQTAAPSSLSPLLNIMAKALDQAQKMPFAADVALSALRQCATANDFARLKACPNCDWLFLDKSKNGSRIWCDMAVCGNRNKARLNYAKRLETHRKDVR